MLWLSVALSVAMTLDWTHSSVAIRMKPQWPLPPETQEPTDSIVHKGDEAWPQGVSSFWEAERHSQRLGVNTLTSQGGLQPPETRGGKELGDKLLSWAIIGYHSESFLRPDHQVQNCETKQL